MNNYKTIFAIGVIVLTLVVGKMCYDNRPVPEVQKQEVVNPCAGFEAGCSYVVGPSVAIDDPFRDYIYTIHVLAVAENWVKYKFNKGSSFWWSSPCSSWRIISEL